MAVGNFGTDNRTLRILLGNGLTHSVPKFQRDYSWTEEEWDDLWRDLLQIVEGKDDSHYMGYLVLQSTDSKNFEIIDGQERMTTLTFLVLAVLSALQKLVDANHETENNKKRIDQLRSTYIGYLDPVSLISKSKLTLNRNSDRIFSRYLIPLQRPFPKRNLKASEHLLRHAFEWLESKILTLKLDGRGLAQLVDTVADKLFFTVITVNDELNAYKVFETLNARGVRLSSTDLLKNYLFSVATREESESAEVEMLESAWEAILGRLGSESFPDFLRAFWNSQHRFVRHSELFKRIRDSIKSKGDVFHLVRQLESEVDVFVALSRPEDELWDKDQRHHLQQLRMYNVRQIYPLLLAARRKMAVSDFTGLLRILSVLSFRYNVIGNNPPQDQERIYHELAVGISNNELKLLKDLFQGLKSIYPQDEEFRNAFAVKQLRTTQSRNKRVVRYILFELERVITGSEYDAESASYSIEHVLPENPDDNWLEFSDEDHDQYVYRLGNMTILSNSQNVKIGNQPFSSKRSIYKQSLFAVTRLIGEDNESWTPERIAARQKQMAKYATSVWRVDQLS